MPYCLYALHHYPRLTVFTSSFCLMVLEIVAGRIMAPYLGVSLYTWTSIIGVVLAGISLGNYLGGRLADKHNPQDVLGIAFLFAGFSTLTINLFARNIGEFLSGGLVSLPAATFIFALFVFFIPSCLLSFITPAVIKLHLKDLRVTGQTVGKIYAASAAGSIFGTFAAGYFLIAYFGTRSIIVGVAVILFIFGARLVGPFIRLVGKKILILFALLILFSYLLPDLCFVESNYYCIQLKSFLIDDKEKGLTLQLDHLVHSYVAQDDVNYLGYDYEKAFALMGRYLLERKNNLDVLFLGGGGYVLPRFFEKNYSQMSLEVSEIDPAVTQINYDKLWLASGTKIVTHNIDARIFIHNLEDGKKYDIIYGDVFNDLSVPYHLTTKEFNEKIKSHLDEDGYYAVNIIDDGDVGSFLSSFVYTLRQSFEHVYVAPLTKSIKKIEKRNTFVVFAGAKPIDFDTWKSVSWSLEALGVYEKSKPEEIMSLVYGLRLDEFLKHKKKILLTDNYAPVDNMLAPVFRGRK